MPANLVVDASVALKWFFVEEHSEPARRLLDDALSGRCELIAPQLISGEIANGIYQRERRSLITGKEGDAAIRRFSLAPIAFVMPVELYATALTVARRYMLKAVYDAHYLAVSEAFNMEFWTADEALIRATSPSFRWIRWIADYTTPDDD